MPIYDEEDEEEKPKKNKKTLFNKLYQEIKKIEEIKKYSSKYFYELF